MRCDLFVVCCCAEVMLSEEWRRSAKMKRPASADNSGWVLVIALILIGEEGRQTLNKHYTKTVTFSI